MGDTRIEIQAKGALREGFQEPISEACVAL
jgi:hypothetical protein